MFTLTLEAPTYEEIVAKAREVADGGPGALSALAPPPDDDQPGGAVQVTNDDYRRAISRIPPGRVAAYSVVSEVVRGDTHGSQHVAGLAANDETLDTAYRVVKVDRGIAAGFRWHDRMGGRDEAKQLLESEGVQFDRKGKVLPEFMMSPDELRELYRQ